MNKALSACLKISLLTFSYLFSINPISLAQVIPDNTVNTQVNQNGNSAEITGGETRGSNLFHSFNDFSVPTGNEAFFDNANNISNIFSRVTGGNISNIDGAIRANGSANLFLINPAGIIFGGGASLNIGGSFYGSSASSILFEDGEFSAADLKNPPLLTVNAPIGLGFRDNPGDIVNRSFAQNSAGEIIGLEVDPGNNLALIGGNINLEGGFLTARGGNIELGGLSEAGTISISEDGSLDFPENITKADINLIDAADVDVRGTGGGSVSVNARNLSLSAGEFGSSFIRGGIKAESESSDTQAGNIIIDASENIMLDGSNITNQVNPNAVGNAGDVTISTGNLSLTNGGLVSASTSGQGDAGAVSVTATGDLTADGQSFIISQVNRKAVGNSGGVTISTGNLSLTNGGLVSASTFGQGNAGAVNITATGDLTADGQSETASPSAILSQVNPNAVGNAGDVTISTGNLSLTNGGLVSASTFGQGNAGAVNITATGDLTADGQSEADFPSGVTSQVNRKAVGNSGGVTISTGNLSLTNGGLVSASTFGQGDAGAVSVTATGDLTADGQSEAGFQSGVTSRVNDSAVGSSGGVTISTDNLSLTNGGLVSASTFGQGDAGSVSVTATGDLTADGQSEADFPSGVTSRVNASAVGNAGGVTISTDNLSLSNGGRVSASTFGQGDAGSVKINATGDITLRNNGSIAAEANDGDGGNVNIDSRFIIAFPDGNNDITATAGLGNGGNININADSLFGIRERSVDDSTNDISASSEFSLDGNVTIRKPDINPVQGVTELPQNVVVETGETTAQACQANRQAAAKNSLTISGKGGIPPAPELPLNSGNITIDGETDLASTIPQPVETSQGKIQPARGIKVTKSGKVILTAYRTKNSGDRIPEIKRNCDQF